MTEGAQLLTLLGGQALGASGVDVGLLGPAADRLARDPEIAGHSLEGVAGRAGEPDGLGSEAGYGGRFGFGMWTPLGERPPQRQVSTKPGQLQIDGEVGGTLNVGRSGGAVSHFDASEFEIAQLFGRQAAIAVQDAEVHHALSTRAETDALTGLHNRGAFETDVVALLADRNAQPLTLLMLDLDGFKAFNDLHGHPAGDALLSAVARAMRAAVRSGDRIYRYGGDEFAVLLPRTPLELGMEVAPRIAAAIATLDSEAGESLTASVGVASHPDDAATRDGLVAAADRALYRAKNLGGDGVAGPSVADVGWIGAVSPTGCAASREDPGASCVPAAITLP